MAADLTTLISHICWYRLGREFRPRPGALPEQGDYCLVHSGHTTCAGGYVELLSTLHRRGVRKLIALVPMRCLGQVALGTELARSLFALPGFTVVNVAVPNPDAAAAVVVDGTD